MKLSVCYSSGMKSRVKNFLKLILPDCLIRLIKNYRREHRQRIRYRFNQGQDFSVTIATKTAQFSVFINPFKNGGVDDDIYRHGTWEPEITALLDRFVPNGGVFLDIGANIGFHSLYARTLLGNSGQVIAFEPLPRLHEQMQKSIEANGFTNITVHNVALADKVGIGTLSLVDENIGASSLQSVSRARTVASVVEVPLVKLDSYQSDFSQLDVVKIDIEGSEFEALQGGVQILRKYKPVIILEFSPQVYENDYTGKSEDLYLFIKNLGYEITVIGDEMLNIEASLKHRDFSKLHVNLLCLPHDSSDILSTKENLKLS